MELIARLRAPGVVIGLVAALVVGVAVGLVGALVGSRDDASGLDCPSVFSWGSLAPEQQAFYELLGGGACAAHVGRMSVVMWIAFVVAGLALVLGVLALVSRRFAPGAVAAATTPAAAPTAAATAPATASTTHTSPPAWHPVEGRPGVLRWWNGERWTDHYHDKNAPKPDAG